MAVPLRLGRLVALAVVAALVAGAVVAVCVAWTRATTADRIYPEAAVPSEPVALVLGKLVERDGTPSPLLEARLELALRLYRAGRVRAILVSGDGGSRPHYDEVTPMRRWLLDRGVPERRVVPDPFGYDTFDSCSRARSVFGVRAAIVVTNGYHLPRAVALCRHSGIDAVGVDDESDGGDPWSWWAGAAREQPATALAVADILLRGTPAGPDQPSQRLAEALAPD